MAMTERQKWDKFTDKYPGLKADAFWWCSGKTWATSQYCVVLVVKHGYLRCALELRDTTPAGLQQQLREAGYRTAAPAIARMCHAAPCSPKRPRVKAKTVDAVARAAANSHEPSTRANSSSSSSSSEDL